MNVRRRYRLSACWPISATTHTITRVFRCLGCGESYESIHNAAQYQNIGARQIEANINEGVVSAPLSKYLHCQTRICRPVGLSDADCETVCRYACERIGLSYDFKNVLDLMRYLFSSPLARRRYPRNL